MAFTSTSALAQANSWTNATGGNWDAASSWSLGVPPNSSQSVIITNYYWKAVVIDSSTLANSPDSMTVSNLTMGGAPIGVETTKNTLLLNYVGAGNPLVVGVDTNTPGSLVIGTNSAVAMFSSGLIVNNALGTNNSHLGQFEVDGTFNQSDNSEVVAGFLKVGDSGTYDLTNGMLFVRNQFIFGHFNQQGGRNLGAVIFTDGGEYDLFDGMLEGGVGLDAPYGGIFKQSGGTNMGSLDLGGPGVYQLSGGLMIPGDLQVGPSDLSPFSFGAGAIEQTGGTDNAGNITMGVGSYALAGGVLTASNLALPTVSDRLGSYGSAFDQSGGYFSSGSVTMNGVYDTRNGLQHSTYYLSGGELETPTINMTMGLVNQTGGTNSVGVVTLDTVSSYVLNGGFLIVSNLTQNGQTAFSLVGSIQQSGGTNDVLGTLVVGGSSSYNFSNGLLIADNIQLAGQAMFIHAGGSFGGLLNILLAGGGWAERTAGEQLGQLQLGLGTNSNSSLSLPSGSCVLRFADSSAVSWASGELLTIGNWSGSLNGGGSQQILFGTTGAGLTAPQLSQVQFLNPAGLPNGTYAARILSDGEVVPDPASSSSGPVNSWIKPTSGNWDDASSWSLGILPDSSQSVLIANSGWKAVSINPSTPVNFPGSMTISNLFIEGATNTENTLLLNNFGTAVPLTVLNGITLQDGAQILNFNSGLVVAGGTFLVTNSDVVQDGGFVHLTGAQMYLSGSVYNLTNGEFECGTVSIGWPVSAHFNQYGGSVIITSFGTSSYIAGTNQNGYSLYGGTLDLPGGMSLLGESGGVSYFQAGGTNRTGQVLLEPNYGGWIGGFTLNGGLLAGSGVELMPGYETPVDLVQNGGSHVITNSLYLVGGATHGNPDPSTYHLNGGSLSAGTIELNANDGDSVFVQSNGVTSAGTIYAHSEGYYLSFNTHITLVSGSLSCSNFTIDDGRGTLNQSGGALAVSNLLDFKGSRNVGTPAIYYGLYTFTGGTVMASNINITDWIIGDGSTNRISNPGLFSLSHLLQISNAVEQLGRFMLASNATINLAGGASRLSFAKSSGETWLGGATLVISNWNGNPAGGGGEQLKFGNDATGLNAGQLSQIQFSNPAGFAAGTYSAQILATGEIVPATAASVTMTQQQNNLVLAWPNGWVLQTATNPSGPFSDMSTATSPYTNNMQDGPQRYFRLRK
jgi:hypothetical protein